MKSKNSVGFTTGKRLPPKFTCQFLSNLSRPISYRDILNWLFYNVSFIALPVREELRVFLHVLDIRKEPKGGTHGIREIRTTSLLYSYHDFVCSNLELFIIIIIINMIIGRNSVNFPMKLI